MLGPGLILCEERVPLQQRHGREALVELLSVHPGLPGVEDRDPRDMVFLDTETTGLAGGTGTVAFLVGLARVSDEALWLRQYLLTAFAGEAGMLEEVTAWVSAPACLVSYNGKGFDVPLLRDRLRLHGLRDVLGAHAHLDLLYTVRRAFGRRWPNCRLRTVEEALLGFRRTGDIESAEVPGIWYGLMRHGDLQRLPAVLRHNLWDLASLAIMVPTLTRVYSSPGEWAADITGLARYHRQRGCPDRAMAILEGNVKALDRAGLLELAALHRREGRWQEAAGIWHGLAVGGCQESSCQLAKYYEHVVGDYARALAYAAELPRGGARSRRQARLRAKLGL